MSNFQDGKCKLPKFGLGCNRMSNSTSAADRADSIATIHAALDAGVTLLNTGDFYGSGHNEMLIGEAIRGYDRDKVFLAVKFGALTSPDGKMYGLDVRPLTIKNYLTHSLKRLQVDYIDLYQPARIDLGIPVEETIGAVADLVKAGYVKHIGISEVDAATLRRANRTHPITLVELEYSLFHRDMEEELLPAARELGIGVTAFGILAHSLLGGGWSKKRLEDKKDAYYAWHPLFFPRHIDQNLAYVEALREIANAKGATLPQLATAWAIAKGDDILPLIGARRVAQLEESLKAAAFMLSESDIREIEAAVPKDAAPKGTFAGLTFRDGLVVKKE